MPSPRRISGLCSPGPPGLSGAGDVGARRRQGETMTMFSRSRRRATALLTSAAMVGMAFVLTAAAKPSDDVWQMAQPPLTTPWTDQVSPSHAPPDYPRLQPTRALWQNLNGEWQFAGATAGEAPPVGKDLPERILVPYPVESALSGIQRHEDH